MASSVNNVHLGPVLITYNSTDAGWTDENGVTVALPGHEFVPILVDEYGVMSIGGFDIGINTESLTIKFNLMENTEANRILFSPLAVEVPAGDIMNEGLKPGTETSSLHSALNLHPRFLAAGNLSRDMDFHLALCEIKGDFQQGVKNLQMLPIEGKIIADTSKTDGNLLFTWGGTTS
jgi:hypothetical protein